MFWVSIVNYYTVPVVFPIKCNTCILIGNNIFSVCQTTREFTGGSALGKSMSDIAYIFIIGFKPIIDI